MEKSLQVIMVAVVILTTAVVVLIIFNKGVGDWLGIFNTWGNNAANEALCNQGCTKACTADPDASELPWTDANTYAGLDDGKRCSDVMKHIPKCKCSFSVAGDTP